MKFLTASTAARRSALQIGSLVLLVSALAGCSLFSSSVEKPKPAALGPNVVELPVQQAWTARLAKSPLGVQTVGTTAAFSATDGTVLVLDTRTGADIWRLNAGVKLTTPPGTDGDAVAVVSAKNDLLLLQSGKEVWRKALPAQAYTAPLVAGGRVFVLAADRSLSAFDAKTGYHLWSQQRPGEPLVLKKSGVLIPVGDTLVVGMSGRLVGYNPDNGSVRWEAPLASPRGTNDVERLVELVAPVSRVDSSVCARAFQASLGCVDTARGGTVWMQPAASAEGLAGDDEIVVGTEGNGVVTAWNRSNGAKVWSSDRLKYRQLTAPLLLGRSVVVGDSTGLVHILSRKDAAPLNRISTDGSGIAIAPVVAISTLVLVSNNGNVYGYRPD